MKSVNPKSVVLKFIQQINEQDADGLAALMSENHLFVEPLGNSMKGRSRIREGWRGYFAMFPDYEISVFETFQKDSRFAPFGAAGGTHANGKLLRGNRWKVPAAWKTVVKRGRISEWRVFADNYKTASLLKRQS